MGKGDKRRPSAVSVNQYEDGWERIFGQGPLKTSTETATKEGSGRGRTSPAVHE